MVDEVPPILWWICATYLEAKIVMGTLRTGPNLTLRSRVRVSMILKGIETHITVRSPRLGPNRRVTAVTGRTKGKRVETADG